MVRGIFWTGRRCSPFKLLLLGLVAMLKAAVRASMRSGSRKRMNVVRESRCNGIDCGRENGSERWSERERERGFEY